MARPHTILQSEYPYNIGARNINKDWFSVPMDAVWSIMSEQLFFIHHAFNVKIHAFVLMSNHFHLLLRTPDSNLSLAMEWFMRETSRSLTRVGNRINQSYGGPYYRSVIRSHHSYLNAYKYLYYNPVKAGISQHVASYPYSTLHGLLGHKRMFIPVEKDETLFSDLHGTLQWLNTAPSEEDWEDVRLALRRQEFKLSRDNGRRHHLEINAL